MVERAGEITRVLASGGPDVAESLLPLLYDELRGLARARMSRERADHTLEATALVHEAYARLVGDTRMSWRDRGHFFGAAAEAMRRVLVDHARRVGSAKRGGDRLRVTLGAEEGAEDVEDARLLALDDALERLGTEDARAAEVVRLRFFCGLGLAEIAAALEVSERTVTREWNYARARLAELMGDA